MPRAALNHVLFAQVARELIVGASCEALAQETGLHIATVRLLIKAMRDREVVRVLRWDPDKRGAHTRPVYRLRLSPFEKDAPRPLSDASVERYHRKMLAEGKPKRGRGRPRQAVAGE